MKLISCVNDIAILQSCADDIDMDCGALDALVICLEKFDPGVKESAAWALGYIARHNAGKYHVHSLVGRVLGI